MKNIIKWKSPGDEAFTRQLAKRLTGVIRPILAARDAQKRIDHVRAAFLRLPVSVRANTVVAELTALLKQKRFEITDYTRILRWLHSHRPLAENFLRDLVSLDDSGVWSSAVRRVGSEVEGWLIHFGTGTAHSQIATVLDAIRLGPLYNVRSSPTATALNEHVLLCSTNKINVNVAARRIPDGLLTDARTLSWNTTSDTIRAEKLPKAVEIYARKRPKSVWTELHYWDASLERMIQAPDLDKAETAVARRVQVYFFDKLVSIEDAKARLTNIPGV
jgi:hypothetical protein